MTDSVDAISAATGIRRGDMLEIWEEVKANHLRLDGCRRHDFRPEVSGAGAAIRYRCQACDGVINASAQLWYQRGLAHAKVPT